MRDLPEGIYRVATGFEVEKLTSEGWRIVEVLVQSELQPQTDMVPQPVPQGGYANGCTMAVTRYHRIQVHKFLVRRDPESALANLTARIEVLTTSNESFKKDREIATKERDEVFKKLQLAEANVTRLTSERDEIRKVADNRQAKVIQMEDAFGKVWQGVGDFGMRQILGTEAVNPKPAPPDQRRTVFERLTSNEET